MRNKARKMFYRARGYYAGNLNGEAFRLDPYHSKFWREAGAGKWEPETFSVLDTHLKPDSDYLDIGAWIGPTVLYGARKARHVFCFEPDPAAYRFLAWNLDLNQVRNVSAFGVALSDKFGIARMASVWGEPGDSTTSLLHDDTHGNDALTIKWEQFQSTCDLSQVSLVKVDIEGAEFFVVPTMLEWLREHRPPLLLSLHSPLLSEDTRRQQTADLLESLSFFSRATDEHGDTIEMQTLLEPQKLLQYRTILLSE